MVLTEWTVRLLARERTAACGAHALCSPATDSVAEAWAGKPVPEQYRLKVSAAGPGNTTLIEPDVAILPDQAPLAVHTMASVLDHVSVAVCPGITLLGLTETVAVALGGGVVDRLGDKVDHAPHPERTETEKSSTITAKE